MLFSLIVGMHTLSLGLNNSCGYPESRNGVAARII